MTQLGPLEVIQPIREGSAKVDVHCPGCGDLVTVVATRWPESNPDGFFVIGPVVSYGICCRSCSSVFTFKPRAAVEPWPEGDCVSVPCVNCRAPLKVEISIARDFDCPAVPVDCESCRALFGLNADGSTDLISVPPKKTSARARKLIKEFENFVFDPGLTTQDAT